MSPMMPSFFISVVKFKIAFEVPGALKRGWLPILMALFFMKNEPTAFSPDSLICNGFCGGEGLLRLSLITGGLTLTESLSGSGGLLTL